ncbi:MAG: DUF5820 family protein [Halobacteriaceae archaeon]
MGDTPLDALPPGWTVWNAESAGRVILAYRPDVFEGESFPAPCLPTIYVSQSDPDQRKRRTGGPRTGGEWHVTLYLEPEVRVHAADRTAADRQGALAAARELAAAFAAGDLDLRDAYQVPREAYLAELERLTGEARS